MNFKEEVINFGYAIAGLFGSLLLMSKTASQNVGQTVLATVGGAASPSYLDLPAFVPSRHSLQKS